MSDPRGRRAVSAPPAWMTALEVRAAAERVTMRAVLPLLQRLPRGDGHAVLVLPGFMADDRSTAALRSLLTDLGYATRGWRLGTNLGPTPHIIDGLSALVPTMVRRNGPISIVGWSLGGIFARLIANDSPEFVRQVITLGSPIQMEEGDDSAPSGLWRSLEHLHVPRARQERDRIDDPLPVPTTAVYTRTDGIVHWSTCLVASGPTAENVEVYGSHCGLGFNPSVAVVAADRLAQPTGTWAPFRPPWYRRAHFPRPADLDSRFRSASRPERRESS